MPIIKCMEFLDKYNIAHRACRDNSPNYLDEDLGMYMCNNILDTYLISLLQGFSAIYTRFFTRKTSLNFSFFKDY